MAVQLTAARSGDSFRGLAPTADPFTPKYHLETKPEALNVTFISQKLPRMHRWAAVIGLCAVPEERAGVTDLGWHISDFLAFRALLCGPNPPEAQAWLSMCDIGSLVEAHPERYFHGKDKQLVGSAAKKRFDNKNIERVDNIQVETDANMLKEKFVGEVSKKVEFLKRLKYPLVLIACGMTSLEQDIYFGEVTKDRRLALRELRDSLGEALNEIEVIVITPALFSAGWQISVSFGHAPPASTRGKINELLARQFGGLFAKIHVQNFLGWNCPALDEAKVDPAIRNGEMFPGPALPSRELKQLITLLQTKIQSHLMGHLSVHPLDHSFSFSKDNDEWAAIMGCRETSTYYEDLGWYEEKWLELPKSQGPESTAQGFLFLGNAFGGNMFSQLNHIKFLIEESYLAWPDHWASNFGQETKKGFELFKMQQTPDYLDCHEIFNILEHRATTSTLADTVIRFFGLPAPNNQRCREWDQVKWKAEVSEAVRSCMVKEFGTLLAWTPGPNVPPGVNANSLSKLQRRLESAGTYVRASLSARFSADEDAGKHASRMIDSFVRAIEIKQAELLISNPEVYEACRTWLNAIEMPVRAPGSALVAAQGGRGISTYAGPPSVGENEDYEVKHLDDQAPDNVPRTTATAAEDPFVGGIRYEEQASQKTNMPLYVLPKRDRQPVRITAPPTPFQEPKFSRSGTQQPSGMAMAQDGGGAYATSRDESEELERLENRANAIIAQLKATYEMEQLTSLSLTLHEVNQKLRRLKMATQTTDKAAKRGATVAGSTSVTKDNYLVEGVSKGNEAKDAGMLKSVPGVANEPRSSSFTAPHKQIKAMDVSKGLLSPSMPPEQVRQSQNTEGGGQRAVPRSRFIGDSFKNDSYDYVRVVKEEPDIHMRPSKFW